MNIQTQICGLIILTALAIFYKIQKKLNLRTEKIFQLTLLFSILAHVVDIISLYAIAYQEYLSPVLVEVICKIYIFTMLAIIACTMSYVSRDIFRDRKEYMRKMIGYFIGEVVATVLLFVLPIEIYSNENVYHTHGMAVDVSYLVAAFYICVILFRTIRYRERLNPDRFHAVLIWMGIWAACALVQYINPKAMLLISFATSVGIMILYIKLENPGMNIDKQSGLFNQNALAEYIRQKFENEETFALISFQLDSVLDEAHKNQFRWEEVLVKIPLGDVKLFRKSEDEGVLIYDSGDDVRKWGELLRSRILSKEDDLSLCFKRAFWNVVYDSTLFSDAEELLYFLRYIEIERYLNEEMSENSFLIADEKLVGQMRHEKKMEKLLNTALKNGWIEVFYQPIFSTADHKFTAAEALVRLKDEQGKLVFPNDFIPIAEKNGKILDLGNAVFEKVCQFIKEKEPYKMGVQYIEVNLSVIQCSDEKLADTCISIMEKYGVAPEHINLEITESASLKYREIFMNNIEKLRNYGISFSLDDFGTGHSNLNYIVDMPVDIVKFDRGMTTAFFEDKKAHYVMEAAMHMIHGMDLDIVSEGIETAEQYHKLDEMGIAYIQGYYFSKPLPQEDFYQFICEKNQA